MPATVKMEVIGVKETVKALRQVDPEIRKQFNRDIKAVLQPALSKIKSSYPAMPLSGMSRFWATNSGYEIFPWNVSKVKRGVTVKTSTRRNKNSVVYISQANPAGVLFETVTLGNELGRNIRTVSPRIMWPVIDEMQPQITEGVGEIVLHAQQVVQGLMLDGKVVYL